jgi:hypothetical protein
MNHLGNPGKLKTQRQWHQGIAEFPAAASLNSSKLLQNVSNARTGRATVANGFWAS